MNDNKIKVKNNNLNNTKGISAYLLTPSHVKDNYNDNSKNMLI